MMKRKSAAATGTSRLRAAPADVIARAKAAGAASRAGTTTRTNAAPTLSHVGADQRPRMVDVAAKPVTPRVACALAHVRFPAGVARALRSAGLRSSKGSIIDTAIIAGTMAVKRTHELIPFCHPLAIERCEFRIRFSNATTLAIRCEVAVTHKTGVEMEALTGATVAALTVYDMCKALSHSIVLADVRLLEKSGGRRTVRRGKVIE